MPVGIGVDIKTGDLEKWASDIEKRGADFGSQVMRAVKSNLEIERQKGRVKFAKIRRERSGVKRFAMGRTKAPKAEDLSNVKADFNDIFKD